MTKRRKPIPNDFDCENCGATVRGGAQSCRECGASHGNGWGDRQEGEDGSWDDEYTEDDYQDFLRDEFPDQTQQKSSLPIHWWWTALVLLILSIALTLLFPFY